MLTPADLNYPLIQTPLQNLVKKIKELYLRKPKKTIFEKRIPGAYKDIPVYKK